MEDVEQIADALYALPPPEFTAARDAAAARARGDHRPEVAERVHRLRRPTLGAWLANLLVREYPDEVRSLLELAAALRGRSSGWTARSCASSPSAAGRWFPR
ncbi:hypothetical protein GXW82_04710 [Streptacidiphilus sp. 4-A2]|nr:hypothetical protein [Streptacidiphilus sp. 4-A2]